jgi:hypothetical protein
MLVLEWSLTKLFLNFPLLLDLLQYFDMIRDVGQASHCRTTFVPSSKTLGDDVRNAMLQAESSKLV